MLIYFFRDFMVVQLSRQKSKLLMYSVFDLSSLHMEIIINHVPFVGVQ